MLDEILELFDRKRDPQRPRSGGLRGAIGRVLSGDDDRPDRDNRIDRDDRRSRDRRDRSRRSDDAYDFD